MECDAFGNSALNAYHWHCVGGEQRDGGDFSNRLQVAMFIALVAASYACKFAHWIEFALGTLCSVSCVQRATMAVCGRCMTVCAFV